jgi:hypothetical protein
VDSYPMKTMPVGGVVFATVDLDRNGISFFLVYKAKSSHPQIVGRSIRPEHGIERETLSCSEHVGEYGSQEQSEVTRRGKSELF